MESNQAHIIELLREVHLIALKEIDRLNLRIAELESRERQPVKQKVVTATANHGDSRYPEIMNDKQVAAYLNISVSAVCKWRILRKGPTFIKIGKAVRYRCQDVDHWLDS